MKKPALIVSGALLGALVAFSLTACGGASPQDPFEGMSPQAKVDPFEIEPGMLPDGPTSSDVWEAWKDGAPTGERIYLTAVLGEESLFSITVLDGSGAETDSQFANLRTDDKHLTTPEGAEGRSFDLVFNDDYTAYDGVSETWYTRGDLEADMQEMVGGWTSSKNPDFKISFNEDGSYAESFSGNENGSGTFSMKATNVVKLEPADESGWELVVVGLDENGVANMYDTGNLQYLRDDS